jgi:hypothetical protein
MSLDLEALVVEFLRPRLSDEEKRELSTKYDLEKAIDEESRDEMKEELFRLIWGRMSAHRIIEALMREIEDEAVEDPSSSEDDEDGE